MQRITIVGLGLIGGSLGLALKGAGLREVEVVGCDREWGVGGRAERAGAIDRSARDVTSAVRDAALVIIATPILAVREVMEAMAPLLREGCVVTDTASTKAQVMRWAAELLPSHVHFVGGHPMAGKERSGLGAADAALFRDAAYCVVPAVDADERAIHTVLGLVGLVGAHPVFLDAAEHDSYVAAVSHLPILVSAALFSMVRGSQAWPEMSALAAGGFRDTTRLASGDPALSHDICLTNKEAVLHWLDRFAEDLRRVRELVEGDEEELFKTFARVQMDREAFLSQPKLPARDAPPMPGAEGLSSGERMAALLVGEHWAKRMREMGRTLDERASGRPGSARGEEREREERLKRR